MRIAKCFAKIVGLKRYEFQFENNKVMLTPLSAGGLQSSGSFCAVNSQMLMSTKPVSRLMVIENKLFEAAVELSESR